MVGTGAAKSHYHRASAPAGSSGTAEASPAPAAFAAAKSSATRAATALTAPAGPSRSARPARITALLLSNGGVSGRCRAAETERLCDPQVHREESRALAEVAGDDLLAGLGVDVEVAEGCTLNVGL